MPAATARPASRASPALGRMPQHNTTRSALKHTAVIEQDAANPVLTEHRTQPRAGSDPDPETAHGAGQEPGRVAVELSFHQPRTALHQRDRDTATCQTAGGFESEHPAAEHDGLPRV